MEESRKTNYRYFAFISYSRRDIQWAKWLQRRLQNYRLPAKLIKEHRNLPKKIFPVFRDQQDLNGIVLEDALKNALEGSQYLIVLCSPNSANSDYVNKEIQHFLALGRKDRIIPFIIDGMPFSNDSKTECFPEALRNITPELLGISVQELGRRKAFLRVISDLLHIHHDEIYRRDGARLAFRRTIAAIAGIAVAAAMGWAIWYNTPHTKYYNAYISRNEVPQGIYDLSEAQQKAASDCYRITTLQGKVIRLETVNSLGTVINPTVSNSLSDYPRQEFIKFDDQNRPTEIELYDDHGMLIQRKVLRYIDETNQIIIDYQQKGTDFSQAMSANLSTGMTDDSENAKKSEIIRQVNTYDDDGLLIRCMYYKDTLGTLGCDSTGVYGKEFEYTDRGEIARITNLDENGQIHNCSYGFAIEAFTYDETGSIVSITYYAADGSRAFASSGYSAKRYVIDPENGNILQAQYLSTDDEPCYNSSGISRTDYHYDSQGFLINRKQYDTEGVPTYDSYGVHCYAMRYDEQYGRANQHTMLDTDGNPSYCKYGFAIAEVVWDAQGRELENWMYDSQGNLCRHKELGISGAVYTYNEKGFQDACYYYDDQHKLASCSFGYASLHYTMDENDRVIRTEYRDTEGNPAHPNGDIVATVFEYDVYGNRSQLQYVDKSGNPTPSNYGICTIKYSYEDGNMVSERYFGKDGEAVISTNGFHEMRMTYDSKGNCTSWNYYNTDGVLTHWIDGYARLEQDYDIYGNITSLRYYDKNGEPMYNSRGEFERRCEYDNRGNCIRQCRYDTDGQLMTIAESDYDIFGRYTEQRYYDENKEPKLTDEGYHIIRVRYDEQGNIIYEAWYGTDGNLSLRKGGYAIREMGYDAMGNRIFIRYFDKNGMPTLDEDGIHEVHNTYDEMGNTIREWYFGTDGQPIRINAGYGIVEWDYDLRGEVIEVRLFDELGQPMLHPNGFHRERRAYDAHGNVIYIAWYGMDGNLICTQNGHAILEQEYDDHGNVLMLRCYDEQAEPVLNAEGYYAQKNEYDVSFNLIRKIYYGTDGKPIMTNMGYAMLEHDFNDQGQVIAFRHYDAKLRQIAQSFLTEDGVHLVERKGYDNQDRPVIMWVFDLYGNPVIGPYGFHENRVVYDVFGNMIQESYYDTYGNLICGNDGFAIIVWDYDIYGRITSQRFYDENEEPTLSIDGYFEIRREYDLQGNATALYVYDTEGNLIHSE